MNRNSIVITRHSNNRFSRASRDVYERSSMYDTTRERDITALLSRFYYDTRDVGDPIVKSEPFPFVARGRGRDCSIDRRNDPNDEQEWHAK